MDLAPKQVPQMAVNGMEHSHKMDGQAANPLVRDDMESSHSHRNLKMNSINKMNKSSAEQKVGFGPGQGYESNPSTTDGQSTLMPPKSKKGSSFMITKVVKTSANEDNDDGELDETNTEDVSSVSLDVSKTTDIEQDPSSEDTVYGDSHGVSEDRREKAQTSYDSNILLQNQQPIVTSTPVEATAKSSATDMEYGPRFQIVRVDNTSSKYQRGRWTCYDYLDERTEKPNSNEKGSGNSSASSSFHYAPGVDDPQWNPFMTTIVTNGHSNITTAPSSVANGKIGTSTQPQNPSQAHPSVASQGMVATSQFDGASSIQFIGTQASHQPSQPPASQQGQLVTQTQSNTQVPVPQQNVPPSTIAMEGIASSSQQQQHSVGTASVSASVPLSQSVTTTAPSVSNNSPSMESVQQSDARMNSNDEFKHINVALDNLVLGTKTEPSEPTERGSEGMDRLYSGAVGFAGESFDVAMVRAMTQGQYSGQASGKEEDESGASTVAIDNKIEQAMDLVKSHLMFAVREEVEVLKEQIKELLEKNSQLEVENNILKAAATADTLAKLSQKTQQSQPPTSSS